MRLHRLEVEGFGPFRERQRVDFDAFSDDGIFLIAGRTGAGKSSILDAVCFGLYGGVPRYESGEKRLRSDHCEPDDLSEVVVEFSTTAGRFRVSRSPEYLRPAKRGGGLTPEKAKATLERWSGEGWIGLAARAVDVATELDGILQLSQSQFLQVILLAQNRFARFLLADSRERQVLLRRLFGTERFEDVQSRFEDRRKSSENALGARVAAVAARVEDAEGVVAAAGLWGAHAEGAGTGTIDERLAELESARARADYAVERADAERDAAEKRSVEADAALSSAREEQQAQQERDRARAALALLDEQTMSIAAAREELGRARAAEGLRSTLLAVTRADAALVLAVQDEAIAQQGWDALGVVLADASAAGLEAWADEQTALSGAWRAAAEDERVVQTLQQESDAAEEQVALMLTRIADEEAERAALPAQVRAATEARDADTRIADRLEERQRERDRAEARRDAVDRQVRLKAQVDADERTLAAASDALAAAQIELAGLRRRRLDGFAGELASSLEAGDPCPVCGAQEHPALAVHADPVSAADVEAAESVRDAAAEAERAAVEQRASGRLELAAALAQAEGRTGEATAAELAAASSALDDARAALGRLPGRAEAVAELGRRAEHLESARQESAEALALAREKSAGIAQRITSALLRIAEARGDFNSVAERIADAAARIGAARALGAARAERLRRERASAEASAEQEEAIEASAFVDASDAHLALRAAAVQDEIDARVTTHVVQREKEREILLALELRTLPEDAIDLAPSEELVLQARRSWTAAVDTAARAAGTAERLAGLIDTARSEHTRSAAQAGEHEVLKSLADAISGRGSNTHKMTLETFVLAAELEEIVAAANRRLMQMQDGRYQLRHSDALAARGAASGLGIVVYDAFTGQTRPAQSLSGGETFLSSLALALGLAEVVTARAGGIQLDTLFIDEGFGSLDADTLDVAMQTLDELRAGGRTVGVISHVEAMQEQIPAQLRVEQTDAGPSRILTPAR